MSKTITLTDEQYAFLKELADPDIGPDGLVCNWVERLRTLKQLPFMTDEQFTEFLGLIPPSQVEYFNSSQPVEEEDDADV